MITSVLTDFFAIPVYLLKMTQLYYSYKQGSEFEFRERKIKNLGAYKKLAVVILIAVIAAVFLVNDHFDQFFPLDTDVKIIAHRAGGNEGGENTLPGLEAAWNVCAYGSEIDIQRTKDGYYVLNHDGTFSRVAGVNKKPEEMTLREVKKLSVDGDRVPTYEEMLIACKGRMVLFTELKGNTADRKMADDAVSLVWTANDMNSQRHFLCTKIDGLITDNVSQAIGLGAELEQRSDLDKMIDKIKTIL